MKTSRSEDTGDGRLDEEAVAGTSTTSRRTLTFFAEHRSAADKGTIYDKARVERGIIRESKGQQREVGKR